MYLKRGVCAAFAAGMVLICSGNAFALTQVSSWAVAEVSAAQQANLEPSSLAKLSATGNITRQEFCSVALCLYTAITGKDVDAGAKSPFTDTQDADVAAAYELGLMNGRGEGIFDPQGLITRQELCKTLDNLLTIAGLEQAQPDREALTAYPDRGEVAVWAQDAVARMLQNGIMRGVSRTENDETGEAKEIVALCPAGRTTREQALLMGLRFTAAFEPMHQTGETLPAKDPEGSAVAVFGEMQDYIQSGGTVSQGDGSSVPSPLPKTEEEKMAFVFGTRGSYFGTEQEAQAAMTEIAVPVWRLQSDGSKKSGKAYITVNRALAPIYQAVFQEIYNGDEKFPIKDVGSYAWRPSPTSEHRWGTAIDINAEENMEATINADGSLTPTCGTHWMPGEDPYSIPEGGDVYTAFQKYGFSWGGNAWRSKRDYMHFSYFGR